jgi:hypothetical protein
MCHPARSEAQSKLLHLVLSWPVQAPSLTELKMRVGSLEASLPAMETRLLKAIEAAKTEVLLMVHVSDLSARNAELEAKLAQMSKRDTPSQ